MNTMKKQRTKLLLTLLMICILSCVLPQSVLADSARLVDELVGGLDQGPVLSAEGTVAGAQGVHSGVGQADQFLDQLGNGPGGGGEHTLVQEGLLPLGLPLRDE